MARSRDSAIDRMAEAAAFLSAQGLTQGEVARRLGTTQSNVSRWLKRAEALGCYSVEVRHRFDETAVTPERLRELREMEAPQALLESLERVGSKTGVRVRGLRVLDRVGSETSPDGFGPDLARFGRAAAGRVDELVRRSRRVAVTWGSTLSFVVDGLAAGSRRPVEEPVVFFPVCAESEQFAGRRESSSVVAARLNAIFNGDKGEQWALTRIPAFIPKRFKGAARSGILAMMHASSSYTRIFGPRSRREAAASEALVSRADALLTSIGHAAHPMGFNYDELLRAGEMTAERLKSLVVGDIGGVLIRRPRLSRRNQKAVDALNAMWTGLKYDALAALAQRAAREQQPGVIVVSCGRGRDEILHALIAKGLVNELILDREAADLLQRRLRG